MVIRPIRANLPPIRLPVSDRSGSVHNDWYRWFEELQRQADRAISDTNVDVDLINAELASLEERKLDKFITVTALENVGGNRAVKAAIGGVEYPDRATLTDGPVVLGLTNAAALLGASVRVQYAGVMTEVTWAWAIGPVFVADNGNLTQAPTAASWLRQIGVAIAPTKIEIDLQPTIALA